MADGREESGEAKVSRLGRSEGSLAALEAMRARQAAERASGVQPAPELMPGASTGDLTYDVMAHVVRMKARADKLPIQRQMRKWLASDPKGFLSKFTEMEIARLNAIKPPAPVESETGPLEDTGTERCLELVDRLLAEHGVKE